MARPVGNELETNCFIAHCFTWLHTIDNKDRAVEMFYYENAVSHEPYEQNTFREGKLLT